MARRLSVVLALVFFTACPGPKVVARYRVEGKVSGLQGSGLVLQLNGTEDLNVRIEGDFSFDTPLADGSAYTVSVKTHPTSPAQFCSVTRAIGTLAGANVVDVEVTCVTQSFAVGGTVSGLVGSGLVLRNNGGDDLTITANGPFRFLTPVKSGAPYSLAVAVQPSQPTQSCTIQSGFGVVGSGDVLDLVVTCMTNPVSIGGRVTGLVGTGLVLQNNGAGDLPVAAGATSYSFTVPARRGLRHHRARAAHRAQPDLHARQLRRHHHQRRRHQHRRHLHHRPAPRGRQRHRAHRRGPGAAQQRRHRSPRRRGGDQLPASICPAAAPTRSR